MENEFKNIDNEKLNKILEIVSENNEIIKKMRRSQKIQNIFRIIYWIILISTALGLFYFLKPTILSIFNDFNIIKTNINYLNNNSTNLDQIKNILKGIGY